MVAILSTMPKKCKIFITAIERACYHDSVDTPPPFKIIPPPCQKKYLWVITLLTILDGGECVQPHARTRTAQSHTLYKGSWQCANI